MGFLGKQAVQYQGYLKLDGQLRRKATGQADAKWELLFVRSYSGAQNRTILAVCDGRSGRWAKVVRVPPPLASSTTRKCARVRQRDLDVLYLDRQAS